MEGRKEEKGRKRKEGRGSNYFSIVTSWFSPKEQKLARYGHRYLQLICFARLALNRKQRLGKKEKKNQEDRGEAWKH